MAEEREQATTGEEAFDFAKALDEHMQGRVALNQEESAFETEAEEPEEAPEEETQEEEKEQEAEPKGKYFVDEDAYELAVEKEANKRAQAKKDKELDPLYVERDRFKQEIESYKEVLGTLTRAEIEAWGDEPQVRSFQESRRELRERLDAVTRREEEAKAGDLERVTADKELNAWRLALETLSPDGDKLSSELKAFTKELLEADTEREMELMAKIKKRERAKPKDEPAQEKETPAPKGYKPISTPPSGPVSHIDPDNISQEDYAKDSDKIWKAIREGKVKR